MSGIALIVGLGNPGPSYAETRHNVGAVWVEALAYRYGVTLVEETKFKARVGRGRIAGRDLRLMIPSTYMNDSGEAVGAIVRFYKWDPAELLVAYDEMAFDPGQVRYRQGGGDNGHNGIRSIVSHLGNRKDFHRLRIGVGHPGDKSRVTAFLTSQRMPGSERDLVEEALRLPEAVVGDLVEGHWQQAVNALHAPDQPAPKE
ncbi:MAG: aminoacyl-tRNA hydrolase [Pseudomonadales bacterium]